MRTLYRTLLRLYPAEHQALFAAEMCETFDHAAADHCDRGATARLLFGLRESAGLLRGLLREWLAKSLSPHRYLTEDELLTDVQRCIRRMEHAIANHDFVKARFYSIAIERLQRRS